MSAPKFLLKNLFKRSRRKKRASGFTLLELLVGLVLTFLIITPLMTLVVSLMNNDRQEQAKNSSQQEIQAALDYIAQDLQQAVYIYDASALSNPTNSDATISGIKDQIPPVATAPGCNDSSNCVPVLAFWKRKYLDRNDTIDNVKIGDIPDSSAKSDRYVYSLVVYYLIKNTNQSNNQTWSQVARIGRFEIRDGIKNSQNTQVVYLPPSDGFAAFDLKASPGSVQQSMNSWTKASATYTNPVDILVDYIDDSLLTTLPPSVKRQFSPPVNDATNTYGYLTSTTAGQVLGKSGCEDQTGKESSGTAISAALPGSSRVPPEPVPAALDTGSFYACVNPINDQGQSVAQVYLRGNALPRLNSNSKAWEINAANQGPQLSYRPTASVRVAVRGLLSNPSN